MYFCSRTHWRTDQIITQDHKLLLNQTFSFCKLKGFSSFRRSPFPLPSCHAMSTPNWLSCHQKLWDIILGLSKGKFIWIEFMKIRKNKTKNQNKKWLTASTSRCMWTHPNAKPALVLNMSTPVPHFWNSSRLKSTMVDVDVRFQIFECHNLKKNNKLNISLHRTMQLPCTYFSKVLSQLLLSDRVWQNPHKQDVLLGQEPGRTDWGGVGGGGSSDAQTSGSIRRLASGWYGLTIWNFLLCWLWRGSMIAVGCHRPVW